MTQAKTRLELMKTVDSANGKLGGYAKAVNAANTRAARAETKLRNLHSQLIDLTTRITTAENTNKLKDGRIKEYARTLYNMKEELKGAQAERDAAKAAPDEVFFEYEDSWGYIEWIGLSFFALTFAGIGAALVMFL